MCQGDRDVSELSNFHEKSEQVSPRGYAAQCNILAHRGYVLTELRSPDLLSSFRS